MHFLISKILSSICHSYAWEIYYNVTMPTETSQFFAVVGPFCEVIETAGDES